MVGARICSLQRGARYTSLVRQEEDARGNGGLGTSVPRIQDLRSPVEVRPPGPDQSEITRVCRSVRTQ